MQSNDNYITVEMFNEGLNKIEEKIIMLNAGIEKRFDQLETEIKEMKQEIRANTIKIEATQNSINTGFLTATLAITAVIAIVGLIATLAPTIKEYFAIKLKSSLDERMQEIAEKVMSRALAGR